MHIAAVTSLSIAAVCAVVIIIDVLRRPLQMRIMNVVWPITALYAGPLALVAFYAIGRRKEPPLNIAGLKGATHCGSGCALGDVIGEFGVYFLGAQIGGEIIWAYLVADLILAWLFGIVFQYFSIVPMRGLSFGHGVVAAIKADTLSIVAFQAGMYAWMLLARFLLIGRDVPPTRPEHWLSMQIAMLIGIGATYPMNLWLIRKGLKEGM